MTAPNTAVRQPDHPRVSALTRRRLLKIAAYTAPVIVVTVVTSKEVAAKASLNVGTITNVGGVTSLL